MPKQYPVLSMMLEVGANTPWGAFELLTEKYVLYRSGARAQMASVHQLNALCQEVMIRQCFRMYRRFVAFCSSVITRAYPLCH